MLDKTINFPKEEEKVNDFWKSNNIYAKSKEASKDSLQYTFFDGPPFATGLPHYGHLLAGTIKDTICRYFTQKGYKIEMKFGWDCHGLPVEYEVDKRLGISSIDDMKKIGLCKYNDECKKSVESHSSSWENIVERTGRWVDFTNGYKTMDFEFMESVWNIFAHLFYRGYVYRAFRVMPYSTSCKTPLSNFEASQNYKQISDPSIVVRFMLKLEGDEVNDNFIKNSLQLPKSVENVPIYLLAWTTTPWTLVSNCGLAINKNFIYVAALIESSDNSKSERNIYIALKSRIGEYFSNSDSIKMTVLKEFKGDQLIQLSYRPLFDYFSHYEKRGYFRVQEADFVLDTDGTGIVHCAPAFGASDYQMFLDKNLIAVGELPPCPIDESGVFDSTTKYEGLFFKDADKIILKDLKNDVVINKREVHSYPHCWRSDTPLMYRCIPNWFVSVTKAKDRLVENNKKIYWVPNSIKVGRFHNWLSNACDWSISRNRFWGTPIPLWVRIFDYTEGDEKDYFKIHQMDYTDIICIGSVRELEELSGKRLSNLHKQFVDLVIIKKDGKFYKRISEVFDCWFESGSVPYGKDHFMDTEYNNEVFDRLNNLSINEEIKNQKFLTKNNFPGDFIAEGIDQTRGWFYTLNVISTILFNSPAFKNVIVNGIVLAENGKKMSKRLKNYPDPMVVADKYGADSLRFYLISSPAVEGEDLRFSEKGPKDILKNIMIPWYNSLLFLTDCSADYEATETDNWFLSRLNTFGYLTNQSMSKYKLAGIYSKAFGFIQDMSNWYIRINRKELRRGGLLLGRILQEFAVIMAPFTPFFSEFSYQKILEWKSKQLGESNNFSIPYSKFRNEESVHLCKGNASDYSLQVDLFDHSKELIEMIRILREKLGLMVKRALKEVKVLCDKPEIFEKFVSTIKNETNVLRLTFISDYKGSYTFIPNIKPNFTRIKENSISKNDSSVNISELCKKKIAIIRSLTIDKAEAILLGNKISECSILPDEITITYELSNVPNSLVGENFSVIVDVTEDDEVKNSSTTRAFYSFVQAKRKSLNLKISDEVYLFVEAVNEEKSDYQDFINLIKERCNDLKLISNSSSLNIDESYKKIGEDQHKEFNVSFYLLL